MAKVKSHFLDISGRIGDFVVVNGPYCKYVRKNTSLNRERVLSDKAFENSRKGMDQFKKDNRLRSLIKRENLPFSGAGIDKSLGKRLSAKIKQVRDFDSTAEMGSKTIFNEGIRQFHGFELNERSSMKQISTIVAKTQYVDNAHQTNIDIHIEIAPSDSWIPKSACGFILRMHTFSIDKNYECVFRDQFVSDPFCNKNEVVSSVRSVRVPDSESVVNFSSIGIQSVYRDGGEFDVSKASYSTRCRLLVFGDFTKP